jgi:hypothetical protein
MHVDVEHQVRFPWPGGRHPWLDAFIETPSRIIGIESKRYEPFRSKSPASLSDAYWRDVWGDKMEPYESVRDGLLDDSIAFKHLDAVQLVKHAFGIRTEAHKTYKPAILLYLYAEPETWPDGRAIPAEALEMHRSEVLDFEERVAGAEVSFSAITYGALLESFSKSPYPDIRDHAELVKEVFSP